VPQLKNARKTRFLLLYTSCFFVVQSAYAYTYAHTYYLRSSIFLQISLRLATWTLPVLICIALSHENPFAYLKMTRKSGKGFLWGTALGAGLILLNVISAFLLKGYVAFNFNIGWELWLKSVILVGFSEEILFRGFFLEKYAEIEGFWKSNVICAVLFLLVHIVGWGFLGQLVLPHIFKSAVYIFFFAMVQGVVLKKTDSLWACIIIHSVNNMLSLVLL